MLQTPSVLRMQAFAIRIRSLSVVIHVRLLAGGHQFGMFCGIHINKYAGTTAGHNAMTTRSHECVDNLLVPGVFPLQCMNGPGAFFSLASFFWHTTFKFI